MSYATYAFYTTTYHGDVLTADNFDKYADRASDYIDYITMGKAAGYTDSDDKLAKCCCALAEKFQSQDVEIENSVGVSVGAVASETVGSHSVSYRSTAEIKAAFDAALLSVVQMYLLPTGLLYRGVPCIRRTP